MFEVINQAWLLTITSPTTACSPTVKAREIHSATPAACTVRHILLLLHFLTERVTGCQMKCSFDSAPPAVCINRAWSATDVIIKRCQLRYPHSNGECHRDHKQNRQLKLNGVLKPNAAGFHVDRLCLTSPFPCIWWLATTREHLTTTYRNSVHRRKSINALSGIYAFISRSERFVMFHLWMILEPLFIQLNCLYFYRWIQHTVD